MRIGKTTLRPAVCCLLALPLLPSAVLADIPPPPTALHRIGFEIFKKHTSSTNGAAAKDVGGGADGLTQEEERELRELLAKEMKDFYSAEMLCKSVGEKFDQRWEDVEREVRRDFIRPRRFKKIKALYGNDAIHLPDGAWKFPLELSEEELNRINARIASVKSELRPVLELEYAKMIGTDGLKKVARFSWKRCYSYYPCARDFAEWNALEVVKRTVEGNEGLRTRLEGVPVELLAESMWCSWRTREKEIAVRMFRDFVIQWMPEGMNDVERRIVWGWMSADCKFSGKPLRFGKGERWLVEGDLHSAKDLPIGAKEFLSPDKDCPVDLCSAADYVRRWAVRVYAFGYSFCDSETALVSKAKNHSGAFANSGTVRFDDPSEVIFCRLDIEKKGGDSPVKLAFNGRVSDIDIEIAAKYCRQLKKENRWRTDLSELRLEGVDTTTLHSVSNTFSGWSIGRRQICNAAGKSIQCRHTDGEMELKMK